MPPTNSKLYKLFIAYCPSAAKVILEFFEEVHFKENETLLSIGKVSNDLIWLEDGIISESGYALDSQQDIIYLILTSGNWICSVDSYLNQTPSTSKIKSITPGRYYSLSRNNKALLLEKYPKFANLLERSLLQYLAVLEKRNRLLRIKNASDRLLAFETDHPEIQKNLPQQYIASYLNMDATELSRIRRKRALN